MHMSNSTDNLFKVPASEYGDAYRADFLTMYQEYVASADRISERRQAANTFFLSINTALLGVTGYITGEGANLLWVAALSGVVFSFTWRKLIASYRSLNTAKFKVIHQLEQRLPFAAYDEEWAQLEHGRNSEIHIPFSKVEAWVPLVFMFLHGLVFLFNFILWVRHLSNV